MKVIQYTLNIILGISLYLEINQLARTVTPLRCNDMEGKAFQLHIVFQMHNLHAALLAGSPKSISQLVAHGSQGTQAAQHNV